MDGDKLHNFDFVGRCYNALKVDALDIEAGGTYGMAIAFDDFDSIPDDRFQKPACTDYSPATGGSFASRATSLSSSYDFHSLVKQEGTVTVSDATGQLFSATLSASYIQTRDNTNSHSSVTTYTSQLVRAYKLSLKDAGLKLDSGFTQAVAELPETDAGSAYALFIGHFGTHYGKEALFGGRMYQRITIDDADYSSFLEEGLNVAAEAKATFDVAAGQASAAQQSNRSQKFVEATKSSTDAIVFAGGNPQSMIDMWSQTVADQPAPIQIELGPLYELLTKDLFPSDSAIAVKQKLLTNAIEDYLLAKGDDVRRALLHYGDELVISLAGEGAQRFISAAQPQFARTTGCSDPRNPGHDTPLRWTIVNAADPTLTRDVQVGDTVALKSAGGAYLDAQAGHDGTYAVGDGLTAPTGQSPDVPSTQWRVALADTRPRNAIVNGDYVRLQSQWQDPDGQLGYLLGEADARNAAQRVYAFGDEKPPRASIWQLSRHPAQKPTP
jgi:hypothetical protein